MKLQKKLIPKKKTPKKLEYIEKFMEEFYLTGRSSLNIFKVNNQNKKYKYVNYDIIGVINSFQISKSMTVDEIFNNYLNKLKQQYEKDQKSKKDNEQDNSENNSNNSDDYNETKNIDKLFSLNKQTFYSILLNIKLEENNTKKIKEIKNINLVSDINNNYNNTDQNLNINNLVNINSERKNLVEEKTSTLFEGLNKTNKLSKKEQQFDNTSIISEVKLKEKFEIRISNIIKNKKEENKEITNDKVSSYSLIEREKNLNEILELISSNSKYIENKKITENSKQNELNQSKQNKRKNKLALIDKDT